MIIYEPLDVKFGMETDHTYDSVFPIGTAFEFQMSAFNLSVQWVLNIYG
jgi:hypothetical protein